MEQLISHSLFFARRAAIAADDGGESEWPVLPPVVLCRGVLPLAPPAWPLFRIGLEGWPFSWALSPADILATKEPGPVEILGPPADTPR